MTFKNAISGLNGTEPILPIAHVTTFDQFESILASRSFANSSKCPRNGLQASYFSYGAPFYIVPNRCIHEQDYDDAALNVVGLLLPSSAVSGVASEVYPFDTGALLRGLYEPVLPKEEELTPYCVDSQSAAEDAAKFVELLYGDNASYVYGQTAGHGAASTAAQASVRKVSQLYRAKLAADLRRRVVEIVSLASIPWPDGNVVLIAPKHYLRKRIRDSSVVAALVADPRIQVCTYNDICQYNPASNSKLILDKAVDWLQATALIGEPP